MEPTKEQVSSWIENFVPKKDLFFVEEKDLHSLGEYLRTVLVVPREEFFNHSSYKQIQFVNSYMYWRISSKRKENIETHQNFHFYVCWLAAEIVRLYW